MSARASTFAIRLLDGVVRVECGPPEIEQELRRIYGRCLEDEVAPPDLIVHIFEDRLKNRTCYVICHTLKTVVVDRRVDVYKYFSASIKNVLLGSRKALAFHGAGIVLENKAVLFPGDSGVGKSTLALPLLRAVEDARLLSDDVLLIDLDDARVHPYPTGLCLRPQTLEMFPEIKPHLCSSPIMEHMWVVDPELALGRGFAGSMRLSHVFMLDNKIRTPPAAIPELSPITPREMAWKMVAYSLNAAYFSSAENILPRLGETLGRCVCQRISMGPLEETTELVKKSVLSDCPQIPANARAPGP